MIPTQRHLFSIPRNVCYLNCAYMSPLMNAVAEAGRAGVDAKRTPWQIAPADFFVSTEGGRGAFARLVGAAPDVVGGVPAGRDGRGGAASVGAAG